MTPEEYLKSRGYEIVITQVNTKNQQTGYYDKIKKGFRYKFYSTFHIRDDELDTDNVIYIDINRVYNDIDEIIKEAIIFKNNAQLDAKKVKELSNVEIN